MEQPSRSRPDACDQCDVKAKKLMRCTGCQQAWYCTKECQQKAWKEGGHKADCKRMQQQQRQAQQRQTQNEAESPAGANDTHLSHNDSSSSSRRTNLRPETLPIREAATSSGGTSSRTITGSSGRSRYSSMLPSSSGGRQVHTIELDAELPYKYRTAADPSEEELAEPVRFTRHEKAAMAGIWPGLLSDGDTHGCTVPMHIMKKLKHWYLRKLLLRSIPGALAAASEEDESLPILQAMISGELKIASARLSDQVMGTRVPGRETLDMGFAFAISVMLDHSPAGIARHSRTGAPKVMIFEPDEYCTTYRMSGPEILMLAP